MLVPQTQPTSGVGRFQTAAPAVSKPGRATFRGALLKTSVAH
jgi:hypothetical protein